MKFIIEQCKTPIYNRIAIAYANSLMEFGHKVYFIDPTEFKKNEFIKTINNIEIDFYISTNENNYIHQPIDDSDEYIFNKIEHEIIFIHHDTLFTNLNDLNSIAKKIQAYAAASNKSWHFSIENSNVSTLRQIGIQQSYEINHASEFNIKPNITNDYEMNLSFVGHLMSSLKHYPSEEFTGGYHLHSLATSRICDTSLNLQPKINDLLLIDIFSKTYFNNIPISDNELISRKYYMIALLNKLSSAYRGELINLIKTKEIFIIGGDLSYGKINDPLLKINKPNVKYMPATENYADTSIIYNKTKINLNITSLQFDSAMNNRVIDIIKSGGFALTDSMSNWIVVDDACKMTTYNSPEELNHLIEYYSAPSNLRYYTEIKNHLFGIFSKEFTYENQLNSIFRKINKVSYA